jgi:predicted nucleic acid-binding protein
MSSDSFFDSNIVVYAFADEGSKTRCAESLMKSGGFISTQVLNEFTDVAQRKLKMTWAETREALQAVRSVCSAPLPLTTALHDAAVAIAERHHYRIYDALIIAAAIDAGCRTLYSEDLAGGQTIQGVRIVNPFAA